VTVDATANGSRIRRASSMLAGIAAQYFVCMCLVVGRFLARARPRLTKKITSKLPTEPRTHTSPTPSRRLASPQALSPLGDAPNIPVTVLAPRIALAQWRSLQPTTLQVPRKGGSGVSRSPQFPSCSGKRSENPNRWLRERQPDSVPLLESGGSLSFQLPRPHGANWKGSIATYELILQCGAVECSQHELIALKTIDDSGSSSLASLTYYLTAVHTSPWQQQFLSDKTHGNRHAR